MNKEKEIEKMAKILSCEKCHVLSWDCPKDQELPCAVYEKVREQAAVLSGAGIGDKKQAVNEFRQRLQLNLSKRLKDNAGLKYSQSTIRHFHDKAQRAVIATFTELYGVDE